MRTPVKLLLMLNAVSNDEADDSFLLLQDGTDLLYMSGLALQLQR